MVHGRDSPQCTILGGLIDLDSLRNLHRGVTSLQSTVLVKPGGQGEITMPAYVIVDIKVTDPVGYEEYKKLAPPIVAAFGGKYLARGGKTETLEGDWSPNRLVILEFESAERAKAWLNSPEYRAPRQLRHRTTKTNMVVVEGV